MIPLCYEIAIRSFSSCVCLYREMGYVQALPAFLKLQGSQAVSKQKAANLSCGMLTVHELIADSAVSFQQFQ